MSSNSSVASTQFRFVGKSIENFVVQCHEVRHNKVRLPKEFTSMFADSLENPLEMITSNGVVWNVEFATFHDEIWLTAGWSKVADWFNFSHKDFAVFRYNGRSSFKVAFFDNNGLKKPAADVPPTIKRGKSVVIIHRHDYNERLRLPLRFCEEIQFGLSNPILVTTGDGKGFPVNWTMRSRTICLTYGWRKVAQQLVLTMADFVFVKLQKSSRLSMKVVRMLPDNIVETRLHYRNEMTIGITQRSTGLEDVHSCEQINHARNMRLFSGIDYVVVVYDTATAKYIIVSSWSYPWLLSSTWSNQHLTSFFMYGCCSPTPFKLTGCNGSNIDGLQVDLLAVMMTVCNGNNWQTGKGIMGSNIDSLYFKF